MGKIRSGSLLICKNFIMKQFFVLLVVTLSIFSACQSKPAPSNDFDPSSTYVMIVGVLEWKDPSLTVYPDDYRKDVELYNLFKKMGVPENQMVLLLDQDATLQNINKQLEELTSKAPVGSTFIFYYEGHGLKLNDGNSCFANYDIDLLHPETSGLLVKHIGETIRSNFKGKMVWLTADCCYSGALIAEGSKMDGFLTLVSTSATASNSSTGNWTFTQTMIDCLSGLPLADQNSDGKISVGEWRLELVNAMKFREKQMAGFALFGIDESMIIANVNESVQASDNIFPSGSYAWAYYDNFWHPVRIIGKKSDTYQCEFYKYSEKIDIMLGANFLKPIYHIRYTKSDSVHVQWNGDYYNATILDTNNGFHYIHYTGDSDYWNEWVMYDRIRLKNQRTAEVLWQGAWYEAAVLEEKDGKYFIHYLADPYEWDEWVGADRIRFTH